MVLVFDKNYLLPSMHSCHATATFNLGTCIFFNIYENYKDEDFNLYYLSLLLCRYNYSKLIHEKMKQNGNFFIFMREIYFREEN